MSKIYVARYGEPLVHMFTLDRTRDEEGHERAACGAMLRQRGPRGRLRPVATSDARPELVNCEGCRRAYNLGPRT